nr:hypothetical protein [Candidatus Sigynarchaeota archaeon]
MMKGLRIATGKSRVIRQLIPFAPVIAFIALFAGYAIVISTPAFNTPDQAFQAAAREQQRVVFTTYFFWYKSGGTNLSASPHVVDIWPPERSAYINNQWFPSNWPGQRDANAMLRNISGVLYKDALTYHPPASQPTYDVSGNVIGELARGIMENITTWFDPLNPAWHEWELRCMIRAGIDVAMPDYWNNGLPEAAQTQEGLITFTDTRRALAEQLGDSVVPRIAMFFDTTCMLNLWAWNQSITNYGDGSHAGQYTAGPDLADPYWRNEFWKCIDRF